MSFEPDGCHIACNKLSTLMRGLAAPKTVIPLKVHKPAAGYKLTWSDQRKEALHAHDLEGMTPLFSSRFSTARTSGCACHSLLVTDTGHLSLARTI
jgi:hypothetical protein